MFPADSETCGAEVLGHTYNPIAEFLSILWEEGGREWWVGCVVII